MSPSAAEVVLAIDIGGTKVSAGLITPTGEQLAVGRTSTRNPVSGKGDWAAAAAMIGELAQAAGPRLRGVGIGSAGPVDVHAGTISPINVLDWTALPVAQLVRDTVSKAVGTTGLEVSFAGDGVCAAAGEHWLGAARGMDDVVVVVVSTGVGGGIVRGGRLTAGPSGNAGHIGHIVVDLEGPDCPCGGNGCVEAISSGPSMVRWAKSQGWRPHEDASAVVLADDARTDDPVARQAFRRSGLAMAAGLVSMAAAVDLTDGVLGGGVAEADDLLFPAVREGLARYAHLEFLRGFKIVKFGLGARAGLIGAAAMIWMPEIYGGTGILRLTT